MLIKITSSYLRHFCVSHLLFFSNFLGHFFPFPMASCLTILLLNLYDFPQVAEHSDQSDHSLTIQSMLTSPKSTSLSFCVSSVDRPVWVSWLLSCTKTQLYIICIEIYTIQNNPLRKLWEFWLQLKFMLCHLLERKQYDILVVSKVLDLLPF